MSVKTTQMAPTTTETSGGISIYKWDSVSQDPKSIGQEFHRITSRAGMFCVTVDGPSKPIVEKAYQSLIRQLGAP